MSNDIDLVEIPLPPPPSEDGSSSAQEQQNQPATNNGQDAELRKYWEEAQKNLQRLQGSTPAASNIRPLSHAFAPQFPPHGDPSYAAAMSAYHPGMFPPYGAPPSADFNPMMGMPPLPGFYGQQQMMSMNDPLSAANRLAAEKRLRDALPKGAVFIPPIRSQFNNRVGGGPQQQQFRPRFPSRMPTPTVTVQANEGNFVYSDFFCRMIPENVKEYIDRAYETLPSETLKPKLEYYLKERLTPLLDAGTAARINFAAEPPPHKFDFKINTGWVPISQMRGGSDRATTGSNNVPVASTRKRPPESGGSMYGGFVREGEQPSRNGGGAASNAYIPPKKLSKAEKKKLRGQQALDDVQPLYPLITSPDKKKQSASRPKVQSFYNKGAGFMRADDDDENAAEKKQARAARFLSSNTPSSSNIRTRSATSQKSSKPSRFSDNYTPPARNHTMFSGGGSRHFKSIIAKCSLQRRRRIVGTCTDIEKPYFRLTTEPDPSQVRPFHILCKALDNVRRHYERNQDYAYANDQLKSIRQDIITQDIRNNFAVSVYEEHVMLAIKHKDREEFNQSQQQLKTLYERLKSPNRLRFTALRLLYYCYVEGESDATELLRKFRDEISHSRELTFARDVYIAYSTRNYHRVLELYDRAPRDLLKEVMNFFIDRERTRYLKAILAAYRPTLSADALRKMLHFDNEALTLEYLKKNSIQLENDVLDVRKYSNLTLAGI